MRIRTIFSVPAAAVPAAAVVFAVLAACAAQAPEERVAAIRADYRVTLNSFQVREEPIAAPDVTVVEESAADPDAEATGPVGSEPRVRQDVILDFVVDNRGDERLPGLTVDVEQADAALEPKTSYRVYLDTSGIAPGTSGAIGHRLEDVEFAPGDVFSVEVRQAIPPEERELYREFADVVEQP